MSTTPTVATFPPNTPNVALWVDDSDSPSVYVCQQPDGWLIIIGAVTQMVYLQCGGGVAAELAPFQVQAQAIANSGKN